MAILASDTLLPENNKNKESRASDLNGRGTQISHHLVTLCCWFNIPLASTCLLTCSPIWVTGQYACGSRRSIKSLTKHPIINYTAFGYNNMSKIFYCQMLADRFVLNLKKWKKLKVPFLFLIFYNLSWGHKILPGTLVRIPIWILPVIAANCECIEVLEGTVCWGQEIFQTQYIKGPHW